TDVERTHRELCARFTNALGGDNPHRHTLFHHRPGRQVHAVAEPADTERGIARHGTADLNLLEPEFLDLKGDLARDESVLPHDHFVGNRIDDVRPAHPSFNRVGKAHFDLLTAINNTLGDTLGRLAVVQ